MVKPLFIMRGAIHSASRSPDSPALEGDHSAVTAPFRFPRFFVTSPSPCPYLPGRQERKVFTELNGPHAGELNDALGRIGFRRSQSVAYRPSCAGCTACVSVRVVAARVRAQRHASASCCAAMPISRSPRAALGDRRAVPAAAPLSRRAPSRRRHGGDGRGRLCRHGRAFAGQFGASSNIASRAVDGERGRLVGACLTDQQADGLSMIYSFFDRRRGERARASATSSSWTTSCARAPRACPMSISAIG